MKSLKTKLQIYKLRHEILEMLNFVNECVFNSQKITNFKITYSKSNHVGIIQISFAGSRLHRYYSFSSTEIYSNGNKQIKESDIAKKLKEYYEFIN